MGFGTYVKQSIKNFLISYAFHVLQFLQDGVNNALNPIRAPTYSKDIKCRTIQMILH